MSRPRPEWRLGEPGCVILRPGTDDAEIWGWVANEYATLPTRFEPGEVVVDIGCHTGALCDLAARRGATVVGYEANRENHALAAINLSGYPSVAVHHAAVWRSDVEPTMLSFTPHPDARNSGGGSVLFETADQHRSTIPIDRDGPISVSALQAHAVRTIALDNVLSEVGSVRFLKVDAEGAEFPILLTARRLDLVRAIGGEYHELTEDQMAGIAPTARVGPSPWSGEVLGGALERAGFEVTVSPPAYGRGLFHAERPE